MEDRDFNEIGLRGMLQRSKDFKEDVVEGRWIIVTRHRQHDWEVIVEPDITENILIVVTAYPVWSQ